MQCNRTRPCLAWGSLALATLVVTVAAGFSPASQVQPRPPSQPTTRPGYPTTQPGKPTTRPTNPAHLFAHQIEAAHGVESWRQKHAVKTDITVRFDGEEILNGTMLYHLGTGRCRIESADGTVLVFDGKKAWFAPADSGAEGARFHLLTWPYFLAAPFKLRDPGSHLEIGPPAALDQHLYDTAKLTFDAGVGDTPNDWYVVYRDPNSNRLHALAYIVTYGKMAAEANKDPHAIVYLGYRDIDGVLLSTDWTFYEWDDVQGVHGGALGQVLLENVEFLTPDPGAFDKPEGAAEDPMPG